MAREFDLNASNYLSVADAPITAAPFTMACWFLSDSATQFQSLIAIGDSAGSDRFVLAAAGNTGGDPVQLGVVAGAGSTNTNTTTGYSTGVWHHACASIASSTSRSVYIDGGSKVTTTASRVPSVNATHVGVRVSAGTPGLPHDGRIAHVAIWDVALTDDEVASLAKGISPLLVRPASLIRYWPLRG